MCDDSTYGSLTTEKDTMGEYMYQTCVAAILLLKVIQGMWDDSLVPRFSVGGGKRAYHEPGYEASEMRVVELIKLYSCLIILLVDGPSAWSATHQLCLQYFHSHHGISNPKIW